jgi:hypothetical protein
VLSRTRDAANETTPRELIHLLSSAREVQLRKLELGSDEPPDEALFDRASLREALTPVSEVRFEQTLCAEYPTLQVWLKELEGEKTQQRPKTLARIWGVEEEQALFTAGSLVEIRFLRREVRKKNPLAGYLSCTVML